MNPGASSKNSMDKQIYKVGTGEHNAPLTAKNSISNQMDAGTSSICQYFFIAIVKTSVSPVYT